MIKKFVTTIALSALFFTLSATDKEIDDSKKLGGSGYIGIGMIRLDLDPLERIVEKDLNRSGFEFDDNRFMTVTLGGFFGPRRNGFRIGAAGTFGYNTLYSEPWKGIVSDSEYVALHPDSLADSIVQLHNIITIGGLIVEKSFSIPGNVSFYAGGMIGGGALVSVADYKIADDGFTDIDTDDDDSGDDDPYDYDADNDSDVKIAAAALFVFEINGGASYTLTKWMHIGLDFSTTFLYSSTGFSFRQGSFMTVYPGLKFRLIFGNAV
ncbi:MAG: hypothetical protein JW915_01610 [Chitinispirillaceae bacterium]|nr:hypothetical protein [Chitinispirillaceae bacterium]